MSIVSKVSICNMALAHCGVNSRIQDIDNETGKAADQCRLFYDQCLNALLEMQRWPFAAEQVTLATISNTHENWDYSYKYPNFVARANFIVNPSARNPQSNQKIPFRIVKIYDSIGFGKAILCDQENAILDFNRKITDPALFTYSFINALAFLLAAHIATPLRVDPSITSVIQEQWGYWANEAGSQALTEGKEDAEPDSEFVTVRD